MPKKSSDIHRRVVDAAMRLAAEKGWRAVTMPAVAEAAGVGLADLYAAFAGKADILAGVGRIVDEAMLAGGPAVDQDESPRDRLFDVMMRRFDALSPYRDGLRRIAGELRGDPLAAIGLLPRLHRSMAWTLEAAGIPSGGLRGAVRAQGLAAVYLRTFRTWLGDESPDLASTMAELDARLRQAEGFASRFRRRDGG